MNISCFIIFSRKLEYSRSGCIFVYISMTTWARLQICWNINSKVAVGNDHHNLKNYFQHIVLGFLEEGHTYASFLDLVDILTAPPCSLEHLNWYTDNYLQQEIAKPMV